MGPKRGRALEGAQTGSDIGARVGPSTRSRVLAAAGHLFRVKGFHGTTTREIAAEVGIENGSLYYHTRGKEDLLYDVCSDSLTGMLAATAECGSTPTTPVERLLEMIHSHVTMMLSDRDKHATMLTEMHYLSDRHRNQVIELRRLYQAGFERTMRECQIAGDLRDDIDARMLTLALLNLLNWTIFWYRPEGRLSAAALADILGRLYLEGAQGRPVAEGMTAGVQPPEVVR